MVLAANTLADLGDVELVRQLPPSPGIADVTTLLHLANSYLLAEGQEATASAYFRKVLLLDPGNADALHHLGVAEYKSGNNEHAARLIERSIEIATDAQKWSNLGIIQSAIGNIPGAVMAYRNALAGDPGWLAAFANLIFSLDLHPLSTPALLLAERRRFDELYCRELTRQAQPHTNSLDPNRPLRVGYVSGDFRTAHSASRAFLPFILKHDPRKVELYLYGNNAKSPDEEPALTAPYVHGNHVWSYVAGLPDEQLAALIRDDQIDVLVDLSGYSSNGRLLTFARKPAPIQVTGWGYATGVGLDCIDYLVADEVTVPASHEHLYHERIIRLPATICYSLPDRVPPVGPVPFPAKGHLTYGYIGRGLKLNDQVVATWAEILRRVPDASLLLKGDEYRQPEFRRRIMDLLVAFGVDERRVKILVATSTYDHMATYNQIDVALDTWPVGSGVTAYDAAVMGVPLVTMLGELIPSRLPTSIMGLVGLTRQNRTVDEYVEHAVGLADDIATLEECRRTLRGRLEGSIAMDGESYCRRWEAELRRIWREHCSEQKKGATA
jgi:protein O-GlcNAc transferase